MTYKTIHTNYGLQRMAQAEAAGTAISIVAVSVGDGGGNPTTPDAGQTQLVREMYRTTPNRVYQDPINPLLWTVEMVVPATIGGFTIRESAAWDDHGSMFVLSNTPDAYKPLGDGSEGSFGDTVIRMQFIATNASVVTLSIDPNVAVASQQWALNTITVPYLLPGGTTGQVLKKKSNADGDTEWGDPTVAAATVSIAEEVQTLAASQTAVTLTVCTTEGLAIYVAKQRLLPTDWTADATDPKKLTLTQSYAAGTTADFVQNEPGAGQALLQNKNLADLQSAATARSNLGVMSAADTTSGLTQAAPPGKIGHFAGGGAPAGWMKANGAAVSRTTYAALFSQVGTLYGTGDGFNTFNLPDLRGEFLRGWDDSRGIDAGRTLGSWQANAFGSHNHIINDPGHAHGVNDPSHAHGVNDPAHVHGINDPGHVHAMRNGGSPGGDTSTVAGPGANTARMTNTEASGAGISIQGARTGISIAGSGTGISIQGSGTNISTQAAGSTETRPRNVAMLACIKY